MIDPPLLANSSYTIGLWTKVLNVTNPGSPWPVVLSFPIELSPSQMGQVCLLSESVGFTTGLDVFQLGGTDELKELKYNEVTMSLS